MQSSLQRLRSELFAGLYDHVGSLQNRPLRRVRLLNPRYQGTNPHALRFAQLEID